MAAIASEVRKLMDLAKAQGWEVEHDDTRILWTPPTGPPVTTHARAVGRGIKNLTTQLGRAGLDISSLRPAQRKTPTVSPADRKRMGDDMADMVDAMSAETDGNAEMIQAAVTAWATVKHLAEEDEPLFSAPPTASAAMGHFFADALASLIRFMDEYGHKVVSEAGVYIAEKDELETQILKALDDVDVLSRKLSKLEDERSKLVADLKTARQEAADATARASKAEGRLATMREALAL